VPRSGFLNGTFLILKRGIIDLDPPERLNRAAIVRFEVASDISIGISARGSNLTTSRSSSFSSARWHRVAGKRQDLIAAGERDN